MLSMRRYCNTVRESGELIEPSVVAYLNAAVTDCSVCRKALVLKSGQIYCLESIGLSLLL